MKQENTTWSDDFSNLLPLINRTQITSSEDIKKAVDGLNESVRQLLTSGAFQTYLDFLAVSQAFSFSRYSPSNQLLLFLQNPKVSLVGTYQKWKSLNRQVNKGEKAYRIVAPLTGLRKVRTENSKEAGQAETKPAGITQTQTETKTCIIGFRSIPVFGLEQTSGEPLPEPPVKQLLSKNHSEEVMARNLITVLTELYPFQLSYDPLHTGVNGFCTKDSIHIREGMPTLQTAKTLVHEYAHSILEFGESELFSPNLERNQIEMRAESVAYTVCRHYGLDTSDYSPGYIAVWGKGAGLEACGSLLQDITHASQTIVEQVDSFVEQQYIRKELKANGLQPKDNLIAEIRRLNAITGKIHSMEEIRERFLGQKGSTETPLQQLTADIVNECKSQQLMRKQTAGRQPIAQPVPEL